MSMTYRRNSPVVDQLVHACHTELHELGCLNLGTCVDKCAQDVVVVRNGCEGEMRRCRREH